MRKNLFFTIALLMAQFTAAQAQDYSKMSFQLQKFLGERQQKVAKSAASADNKYVMMLVQGDDDALRPYSISHQGDIHIVRVPVGKIAELSEDSRVRRMEADFRVPTTCLDQARVKVGGDLANSGFNLPQAFDGTGVMVGNADCAFELTHPTFRSAKDGHLRIVRFWDLLDFSKSQVWNEESRFPCGVLLTDTTDIINKHYSADAAVEFHGTHTASISSGSGLGTPYQGIAPESELYLTTMFLGQNISLVPEELSNSISYKYTELLAFENMFAYADSLGKPCVINYSAGSPQSLLDGDLYEEYTARITGPGKILVAAAGNDGINKHNFAELREDRKRCGGQLSTYNGTILLQIKTKDKLKMTLRKHDGEGKEMASKEFLLDCVKDGDNVTSPTLTPNETNYHVVEELDSMKVDIWPGIFNIDNNYLAYVIELTEGNVGFYDAVYTVELEMLEGENYADAMVSYGSLPPYEPASLDGFFAGSTMDYPSSLPCAISVGATQWRNSFMSLSEGKELTYKYYDKDGKRAFFSSIGPSIWGITKPDVMAPGTVVLAAYNKACERLYDYEKASIVSEQEYDGEKYYYIVANGTSMSAPIVSGVIALWLQADPTLTRERIMDIIARTSRQPDPELDYPNNYYGYGEIDAYAGLLDILGLSGTVSISKVHLQGATALPTADGNVRITFATPTDGPIDCRLYSTGGSLLKSVTIPASTSTYDVNLDHHQGIVAVQVGKLGSTLVRL